MAKPAEVIRLRALVLLRDNLILGKLLLECFKERCKRVDNGKYNHGNKQPYIEIQKILISKNLISSKECELE